MKTALLKRVVSWALVAAAVVASASTAHAYYETVNGTRWTYAILDGKARIIYDNGVAASPKPTGAVTIPSTLGGKPVTEIGPKALYQCTGITSVTIPSSVQLVDQ